MMFLYNTMTRLYGAALWLASPFVPKARLLLRGRRGLLRRIEARMEDLRNGPGKTGETSAAPHQSGDPDQQRTTLRGEPDKAAAANISWPSDKGSPPDKGRKTLRAASDKASPATHIPPHLNKGREQEGQPETFWVHCASLGEFEQGRPVIEALRQRFPDSLIVLTFFSPSGYEVRKNYDGADAVFYLPADTVRNARRFVRAVRPTHAVFVKYEYWRNYLAELRCNGIPSYVVSAIFRPGDAFFKRWGGFMRRTIGLLTHFYVQNQESKDLLAGIGLTNASVCGDTRFDRVATIVRNAPELPVVEAFTASAGRGNVAVFGSTWPDDESHFLDIAAAFPGLRFVVAPHEIDPARVSSLVQRFTERTKRTAVCYTQTRFGDPELASAGLLVVDTIGILSGVYRYGGMAYIGGGFGRGIHNTLEAATWAMPLVFGPAYRKFAEACDLVALGAAHPILSVAELKAILQRYADNPGLLSLEGATAESYVRSRTGATAIVMEHIFGGTGNE